MRDWRLDPRKKGLGGKYTNKYPNVMEVGFAFMLVLAASLMFIIIYFQ